VADKVSFHELSHVVRMTVFKAHARQSTNNTLKDTGPKQPKEFDTYVLRRT